MPRIMLLMLMLSLSTVAKGAEPLECVPLDSAVVMHVKFAKLLDSPLGKPFRTNLNPELKAYLDGEQQKFGLTPDMVDTITYMERDSDFPFSYAYIVKFRKPYKPKDVLDGLKKQYDDWPKRTVKEKVYPRYTQEGMVLTVVRDIFNTFVYDARDPNTLIYRVNYEVPLTAARSEKATGPFAEMLQQAKKADSVFTLGTSAPKLSLNISPDFLPEQYRPFKPLLEAAYVGVNVVLKNEVLNMEARFSAENNLKAKEMERSLGVLLSMAQLVSRAKAVEFAQSEFPIEVQLGKFLEQAAGSLRAVKIMVNQNEAVAVGKIPATLDLQPLVVNAWKNNTDRDWNQPLKKNLRTVMFAMHDYHDEHGTFPAAASSNKRGKKLLSWRVALLPHINEKKLYEKFHLDEPWDSEHNLKVMQDNPMPKAYIIPGITVKGSKETHLQGFVGATAAFSPLATHKITSFTDGTSNTLVFTHAAQPIPWTKPGDIEVDGVKDVRPLLLFQKGHCMVAFCDGSVRRMKRTIDPKALNETITRNGAEVNDTGDAFED